MQPVELRTARLVLDQPQHRDHSLVVEYCRDPLFETFMTLPWPYEDTHADYFILQLAPGGWATETEFTWALRYADTGPLLGVIGYRVATSDIGYWLGSPHRGLGLMPEAVGAVTQWLFENGVDSVSWECVVGNAASVAVARKAGFTYTGERPSGLAFRDGSKPLAWHGVLRAGDSREPQPGWPA